MKVKVGGPFASQWPDGSNFSPAPGAVVEVDDTDDAKVAHLRQLAAGGLAEILEDVKAAAPAEPTLQDLRSQAEAKGLPTYGSKAQLLERLQQAEANSDM